ncbi:Vesicle-associated protein 4-1 [Heracleum sosnowskyi]|uniref:Vesicle-associated protein 4-1 n=1 Tax=Heracleum sosnowskyi TaxID=360622 RepID=A0AAD8H6V3_9APIA|nr:Vesicle-associated protein 4-1 [Heracleum sosnowskyi]
MPISDYRKGSFWNICSFWKCVGGQDSSSTHNLAPAHQTSTALQFSSKPATNKFTNLILPRTRRLRFDPSRTLYFPYEAGKQVTSAVRMKNASKSHVAFKFQTTAPKSCFMRPPGGILAPAETLIATVFKFVELPDNNEKQSEKKSKVKFKIMSLKVNAGVDYVPELFDEQKDQVTVERVLRVVFLDAERSTPALEKLKRQLAEAESAIDTRKKSPATTGPPVVGEGLVIDEWKERREKYLARQQVEAVDSV